MGGSADTAGMPDTKNRRAFFRFENVCRGLPLEMKLESTPCLFHSETCAASDHFFGMRFGCIFSLEFLSSSPVAAFWGPNSDGTIDVYFAASRPLACERRETGVYWQSSAGLNDPGGKQISASLGPAITLRMERKLA